MPKRKVQPPAKSTHMHAACGHWCACYERELDSQREMVVGKCTRCKREAFNRGER